MATDSSTPVLLLSTGFDEYAKRSGYGLLCSYLPEAEVFATLREDSSGGLSLFGARIARRLSFSRVYLGSSARIEWRALRRLRHGFEGIVHELWADHDLGFLDLALNKHQHYCGTFHNCIDTFPRSIRFPSRVKRFGAIILMSETQRPFFLDAGVDGRKVHVVHHGVDTDYFTPGASVERDGFTALSVGGYRRNFPLLAEICRSLQDEPSIRFVLVAPPDFRPLFAGLDNVEYLSGISDEALLEHYQTSSCLLHIAENATANNVVVEAMACGLPIVSERLGGIPEYAIAGTSMLSDPGDGTALVAALRRLSGAPELQAEMRAASRARAEELSWEKIAAQTREVYATIPTT